jgi:hypothetical protein
MSFIAGLLKVPAAYNSDLSLCETISRLIVSLMSSLGIGGLFKKEYAPCKPISSASKATKRSVFRGLFSVKYFALASMTATPDALSSAPLKISELFIPT